MIDQPRDRPARADPQDRAHLGHARFVDPLERRERRHIRFGALEVVDLLGASVDKDRQRMAERRCSNLGRWVVEQPAADQGQRSDHRVAERIMEHGRASARGVEAGLLLGL